MDKWFLKCNPGTFFLYYSSSGNPQSWPVKSMDRLARVFRIYPMKHESINPPNVGKHIYRRFSVSVQFFLYASMSAPKRLSAPGLVCAGLLSLSFSLKFSILCAHLSESCCGNVKAFPKLEDPDIFNVRGLGKRHLSWEQSSVSLSFRQELCARKQTNLSPKGKKGERQPNPSIHPLVKIGL